MKKSAYLLLLICTLLLVGCTENQRARNFGGTSNVDLPAGQKMINVTWKGDDLWYATRPMRSDEQPETYTFKESSSMGITSGTVILKERR
jgi:hypothetical protein